MRPEEERPESLRPHLEPLRAPGTAPETETGDLVEDKEKEKEDSDRKEKHSERKENIQRTKEKRISEAKRDQHQSNQVNRREKRMR